MKNENTQHTPGPWRVSSEESGNEYASIILGGRYNGIIARAELSPYFESDETEANAQLIASAPDLKRENEELKEENKKLLAISNQAALALEASNQYSFFLDGYANGSASIAECNHAADELHKAQTVLFELLKTQS